MFVQINFNFCLMKHSCSQSTVFKKLQELDFLWIIYFLLYIRCGCFAFLWKSSFLFLSQHFTITDSFMQRARCSLYSLIFNSSYAILSAYFCVRELITVVFLNEQNESMRTISSALCALFNIYSNWTVLRTFLSLFIVEFCMFCVNRKCGKIILCATIDLWKRMK